MSLQSTAQEIITVIDPSVSIDANEAMLVPLELEVSSDSPYEHGHGHNHEEPPMLEVESPESLVSHDENLEVNPDDVIEISLGFPKDAPPPAPALEIHEDPHTDEKSVDDNEVKSKKSEKWDWSSRGAHGFVTWIKERAADVPKHSGYDTAGLERAVSYLEKLDNEISKAMRLDLDGELDANKIEEVRSKIDDGISSLHDRLDKVKQSKKPAKKKKAGYEVRSSLVKEAQKITGVQGTYVMVDLLTSGIARTCINGMVSAGHDIEDIYEKLVKKFGLNKREQAQVIWHLYDMGYPLRRDRGFMPDEDVDETSSDNMDFAVNYKG